MKGHSFVAIIVLIILFFSHPSSAYDFQYEDIWVYKGCVDLGPGEKFTIERYTIKVHSLDHDFRDASAVILIYKNNVFKKAYYVDAGPNNQVIYDNDLKIEVKKIDSGKISLVLYVHEFEKVWMLSTPKVSLLQGDVIKDGVYAVSLTNFSSNKVNISVESPNSKYENSFVLNEYKKYDNEFMVKLVYIDKSRSQAFIETYRPGKPEIEIYIDPSKSIFDSDEPLSFRMKLKNNGTITLRGTRIDIKASDRVLIEPKISLESLAPLQTVEYNIDFQIPPSATGKSISFVTDISGWDYSGNLYHRTITHEFFVNPYISITKKIIGNKSLSGKTVAFTHEKLKISIELENTNDVPIVVNIKDTVPESFQLLDTSKLEWEMLIDPHTTNEVTYIVTPTIPGNFTLGKAVAKWKDNLGTYEVMSVAPEITVNGSYIIADKSVNTGYVMEGENITVTLHVANMGDQEVFVNAYDTLPIEAHLIRGNLVWYDKLGPGENVLQSYEIFFSEAGEYVLPKFELVYTDKQMNEVRIYSNDVEIYVDKEVSSKKSDDITKITSVLNPTPGNKITKINAAIFLVSAFFSLLCIIALIPMALVFLMRKVYN